MTEDKYKPSSDTIFTDSMEISAANGDYSKEAYDRAKELAAKEGERRSNTLMGQLKREWRESKGEFVKSLFKGVRGLINLILTSGFALFGAWATGLLDKIG